MANTILVIGESGTGKSTSIRNLDPKETFIINVVGKALPFRGYKAKYTPVSLDWMTGNYVACDEAEKIIKAIEFINAKRPDIKNIILDDFQYTMANEFMRKAVEKGYEKFTKIGQNAWMIINALNRCRDDLECFVLSHSEIDVNGKVKCKTIGKMLDDKITLEGMFTIVLHTMVEAGKYSFLTQNDGVHIAKSPMGMFEDKYIANDLQYVKSHIQTYMNEDIAL